ncbi:hypothetical protein NQ176_g3612 [Zarea fungicola]|uniref:Uncharacterized protein n=1 Tax=Zarea fungicola TaxID=93591 RepID=A0ACC1NIS2_9HYPO|nr:hypothetical protein NQ176_g3612 [Lecanicillium fungicola]
MVEDYSSRAITKGSDRLPALSGLAHATIESSKDVYMAGIWKSSLMEGLSWCGRQGAGSLGKHDEYIAPSFSWASVVGPVLFPLYQWYDRAQWVSNMADFEPLATCIGHEFQLRDQDPNGRLEGGCLHLRAALWPISAIEPRQAEDPEITPDYYFGNAPERSVLTNKTICARYMQRYKKTTQIWIEGGFDVSPNESEDFSSRNLFIIFLVRLPFILENGFLEYRFGIIVEQVGLGATYRRVGFVDGFILSKAHSTVMRKLMKFAESEGAELFGVQGFRRPLSEGDLQNTERLNDLASDPFTTVELTDITLI